MLLRQKMVGNRSTCIVGTAHLVSLYYKLMTEILNEFRIDNTLTTPLNRYLHLLLLLPVNWG